MTRGRVSAGVGVSWTANVDAGLAGVVMVAGDSALLRASLQPVTQRLAAREAKAINRIPDKLVDTRAGFTLLF